MHTKLTLFLSPLPPTLFFTQIPKNAAQKYEDLSSNKEAFTKIERWRKESLLSPVHQQIVSVVQQRRKTC